MVRLATVIPLFTPWPNLKALLFKKILPLFALCLLLLLGACSSPTPPTELAPPGEIVEKALLMQLNQTQQRLSQQLKATDPNLEVSQINVKTFEPIYVADLPAYHLNGTYTLKLTLPRQQVTQKNNPFELYLQRQMEGKTWRLLRRDVTPSSLKPEWRSYLIKQGTGNRE